MTAPWQRSWLKSKDCPLIFVRDVLGAGPEPWQAEALEAVGKRDRVSIRSGHGVGKTTLEAWLILWFLLSGNPKGRPKGARNRLGTQFLEALEADFNKFGPQAIAFVREKKPEVYIKVVADLLPKEANINVEAGEAFVQLWKKISEGFGDELADRLDEEPSGVLH